MTGPLARQALRNLAGLAVFTLLSQACAFAALLVLTSGLAQDAFGSYVFATNVLAYLVAFGGAGLVNVVVRDLGALPEREDQTTAAYLSLTAAGALLVTTMGVATAGLWPVPAADRQLLAIVSLVALPMCVSFSPLYDAHHRQALSAAVMVPGDLLMLGGLAGLAAAGRLSASAAAVVLLVKWAVTLLLQVAVFHVFVRRLRWAWDGARAAALLRSGAVMLVTGIFQMVPLQGAVVLARLLRGERDTALYGVAFQLATVYLVAGMLVLRVVQPHIVGPRGHEPVFVRRLVAFTGASMAALWLAGVGAAWILTHWVLASDYEQAFGTMVVLLGTAAAVIAAGTANLFLLRARREHVLQWIYAGAAVAYLLLAWLLSAGPLPLFAGASLIVFGAVALVTIRAAKAGRAIEERTR
jgi:O-antigen/teichoic acid export membrane protein